MELFSIIKAVPVTICLLKVNNWNTEKKMWNMFKFNNKDTRTTSWSVSRKLLTAFNIHYVILVSLLLTLNIFHIFFYCFYCWLWKSKCLLRLNILAKSFIGGHPLSTYAKFSEKLTFLTSWYAHVRVRIKGLEMLVFRKILRTYLMDDPLMFDRVNIPLRGNLDFIVFIFSEQLGFLKSNFEFLIKVSIDIFWHTCALNLKHLRMRKL